jgi:hypothetical protein
VKKFQIRKQNIMRTLKLKKVKTVKTQLTFKDWQIRTNFDLGSCQPDPKNTLMIKKFQSEKSKQEIRAPFMPTLSLSWIQPGAAADSTCMAW